MPIPPTGLTRHPRTQGRTAVALATLGAAAAFTVLATVPWAIRTGGILIYSMFGGPAGDRPANFAVELQGSRFVAVGDAVELTVHLHTPAPVNLVAGALTFPERVLGMPSVHTQGSVVNLWIVDPSGDTDTASMPLRFAGGIQREEGGFVGEAAVLTARFTPVSPGVARVSIIDGAALAHDGYGTELLGSVRDAVLMVRGAGEPSPDLDGDNAVGVSDVGVLMLNMKRRYKAAYDLNRDGRVNLADVRWLRAYEETLDNEE